jgi:sulfur relay protein TusB/DsrH
MSSSTPGRVCLHLVVRSSDAAIESCLAQFGEGDTVLFIDDGVVLLTAEPNTRFEPLFTNAFYSVEDLDARGLAALAARAGVRTVNDSAFPELLQRHDLCLTWK